MTGLTINLQKSEFVPIAIPRDVHSTITRLLGCTQGTFPMRYLGLPLSIKRPNKADYLPVLQKIQARLAGGQNTTLSLAGRKVLVNSVINALPLHYMQVFLLPQWLIKHIERTKRAFFWKGKGKCIGGHCLVNWTRVCLPIEHGGMGIRDLKIQNISLLLKWLWNLRTNQNSL
jgi:hypothetical protein